MAFSFVLFVDSQVYSIHLSVLSLCSTGLSGLRLFLNKFCTWEVVLLFCSFFFSNCFGHSGLLAMPYDSSNLNHLYFFFGQSRVLCFLAQDDPGVHLLHSLLQTYRQLFLQEPLVP